MKKSRFSETEIVYAIKQIEAGIPVPEVARKYGVSDKTIYAWRKQYGGLTAGELARLKQLEEENRKLKQMTAADLAEDKQLQDERAEEGRRPRRKRRRGRADGPGCEGHRAEASRRGGDTMRGLASLCVPGLQRCGERRFSAAFCRVAQQGEVQVGERVVVAGAVGELLGFRGAGGIAFSGVGLGEAKAVVGVEEVRLAELGNRRVPLLFGEREAAGDLVRQALLERAARAGNRFGELR